MKVLARPHQETSDDEEESKSERSPGVILTGLRGSFLKLVGAGRGARAQLAARDDEEGGETKGEENEGVVGRKEGRKGRLRGGNVGRGRRVVRERVLLRVSK